MEEVLSCLGITLRSLIIINRIEIINEKAKNSLLYGAFYPFMHLLFLGGVSMILSKKTISISLLMQEAMDYLLGMKKKQTIQLNIGLERILSFLLSYNAPAQYSKQKELNDR
tara:strand:+ start:363 stop:698 length:336 start_codon:yes stop_codon:yes gene_type:complete